MRPIDYRVDTAYMQALHCVEFRLPRDIKLPHDAYGLALGLRYGLIGAAATHQLLLSAGPDEEGAVRTAAAGWKDHVSEHLRSHLVPRLPARALPVDPEQVGDYAGSVMEIYLSIFHRACGLGVCLEEAGRAFASRHKPAIRRGWPWFRFRKAHEVFRHTTSESVRFAGLFFERRQADLEEVQEIALLGE